MMFRMTPNDKNTHMHGISDPTSVRVNMGCLGRTKALYLSLLDIADVCNVPSYTGIHPWVDV